MLKNNGGFVCFTQTKAIQHLYIFLFHRVTPRAFTNRKTFCAVAASSYISICTVTQRTHHTNIVLAHTKALSDKKKNSFKKRLSHTGTLQEKILTLFNFCTERIFHTHFLHTEKFLNRGAVEVHNNVLQILFCTNRFWPQNWKGIFNRRHKIAMKRKIYADAFTQFFN